MATIPSADADILSEPTLSSLFVGREQERHDLLNLMRQEKTRLITLVSPSGMGKTQLMLHLAEHLRQTAPDDPLWMVFAGNCTTSDALIAEMARAGGHVFHTRASAKAQLFSFFAHKRGWMLVDNFEQLTATSVDFIDDLLNRCPDLRLFITSRVRLNLSYETVFHLKGLACSASDSIGTRTDAEAVELFVRAARRTRHDFDADGDTRAVVEQICALVGGMPLAILLAAAWIDALSLHEIVNILQNDVDFLRGDWRDLPQRHRHIETVLQTTWEQLSDAEQIGLAGLATFRNGFTLPAAQIIMDSDPISAADLIRRLTQKSLLWRDASSGRCFIHELIRSYAEKQIPHRAPDALERHTDYFVDLVSRQRASLRGADQDEAVNRIGDEWDNIRHAWEQLLKSGDHARIHTLSDSLYLYFDLSSQWFQGEAFFEAAYRLMPSGGLAVRRIHLYLLAHPSHEMTADRISQMNETLAALAEVDALTDPFEAAFCHYVNGHLALVRRDWRGSHDHFMTSLHRYEQLADPFYQARLLHMMGYAAIQAGDLDTAQRDTCASIEISRAAGNRAGHRASLFNLGSIAMWQGFYSEAQTAFDEAMVLSQAQGNWWGVLIARQCLSSLAFYFREYARAKAMAAVVINESRQYGYSYGLENGLRNLHRCLIAEEAYAEALALYERESSLPPDERGVGLAAAHLGMGQVDSALPLIIIGLQSDSIPVVRYALCCAAVVFAERGQDERAVECLSTSERSFGQRPFGQRPFGERPFGERPIKLNRMLVEQFPLFHRLYQTLERRLAPPVFASVWRQGQAFDLMRSASQVKEALEPISSAAPRRTEIALPDDLSVRERQVLTLVAQGCTNQTIADQLVLEIDTVKKHLTHIYRKLHVSNRTQALMRAQELRLL